MLWLLLFSPKTRVKGAALLALTISLLWFGQLAKYADTQAAIVFASVAAATLTARWALTTLLPKGWL